MKQGYIYGKHVEIFTANLISYFYDKQNKKFSKPPTSFPLLIHRTTKDFIFVC